MTTKGNEMTTAHARAQLILPISLGLAALALLAGHAMQPAPASAIDQLPLCEETTSFPCYSDFGDIIIVHP